MDESYLIIILCALAVLGQKKYLKTQSALQCEDNFL